MSATVQNTRICIVAITRHGAERAAGLAHGLPQAHICTTAKFAPAFTGLMNPLKTYAGALRDEMADLFAHYDQLVFFVSLGAVVRLIAPHLQSKEKDPGVTVVDDAGQFVVPVLSGHVGGANAMSECIADLIGATPVVTTASDVGKTISVDILGRHLGWRVEAPKINITRVSAHVVNGEAIALVQETGSTHWWTRPTPLPHHIELLTAFHQVRPEHHKAVLWITHAPIPSTIWLAWAERLVVYRPPLGQPTPLAVGLGCDRGTPLATVQTCLNEALALLGATLADVVAIASIDLKADEPAFTQLAALHGWALQWFSPAQLAEVPVPNPSATVLRYVGTPSVSEAAALLAGRMPMSALLVEKHKLRGPDGKNATVSIARAGSSVLIHSSLPDVS